MTELSQTQAALLTTALTRTDRCLYPITTGLKGGAVGNVARSLLKRGLVEEVPAGRNSIWRHGEDGTALTLRATRLAGRVLAGEKVPAVKPAAGRGKATEPDTAATAPTAATSPAKRGSAQQALVALLRRPEGATIAELQPATGWQPHSVRGALSGIVRKKLGHQVSSIKEERGRVYRITS